MFILKPSAVNKTGGKNVKKYKMVCYPNRRGKAHDGDTIQFAPAINGFRFARLPNINTPEKGQVGYARATADLQNLIRGKILKVCPKARDRTRLVADVFAGSVNVTNAMKQKGW